MTRELRDPLDPLQWRKPLALMLGGLAVVLALSIGVPAVLHARAAADQAAGSAVFDGFTVLVAGFTVPAGVDEPCAQGAVRCWTTTTTSEQVRTSAEAQLRAAGVSIEYTSCVASPRVGLDENCVVTGSVNGRAVTLSAAPRLAPEPPIRQVTIDVRLFVDRTG